MNSKELLLTLPLYIDVPRKTKKAKRISLTMNWYRNAYFYESNVVKTIFKDMVKSRIVNLGKPCPKFDKPVIVYHFLKKGKRRTDLMNWVTVIDKFLLDALVELEILPDDNTDHVSNYAIDYLGTCDEGKMIVKLYEEC